MARPDYDRPFPVVELAKCWRQRNQPNKRLDVKILMRWALKGLSGDRLPTVRVAGRVCSTVRWLAEFLRKTGADRTHRMPQAVCEAQCQTLRAVAVLARPDNGPTPTASPPPRGVEQPGTPGAR